MSLSSVSVKRAVTVSMVYLAVVGFGLFEYSKLPQDLFPDISFPMVVVVTQYAGSGPKDVEKLVTQPIENAVASVEGVKEINSQSKYGMSVVRVEFNWGTDMFRAETDIRKNIDLFATVLPDAAEKPITFAFDPSLQPVVFLMVNGPYGPAEMRKIAEDLVEPRLERIPGVADANTAGGLKREIQVELIPERLRALMVAPQQVLQAIRTANVQLPGGSVRQGGQLLSINTQGRFVKVDEIKEVIVTKRGDREIRVKDVARVRDWFQEPTRLIRSNGKSSVMMLVRKQSDANTLLVAKAVLEGIPDIERQLPKGVKLDVMFAQSDMINRAVGNVLSTGQQAFLLAGLVLLLFLANWWAAVIVSLAIPISLVVTFPVMNYTHTSLNMISLTGLALAIGMLVDNAIVVIENVYRHMELGKPAREAAIQGAEEVGMAITASTLTTLSVFIPVLFVPGIVGALFKDMVVTICLSISASLIVARTLIPMAASRLLKTDAQIAEAKAVRTRGQKALYLGLSILFFPFLLLQPVARATQWFLRGFTRGYGGLLRVALRWRKTTLLVALGGFVGSIFVMANLGRDFMPKGDNGMIVLQVTGASGNNLQFTSKLVRDVEKVVKKTVPESKVYAVDLGVGEGIGAVFGSGEYAGLIRIRLPPLDTHLFGKATGRTRTQPEIEEALRKQYEKIPGLEIRPFQFSPMGNEADIVVNIYQDDLAQAKILGEKVRDELAKIPGLKDVKSSMEESSPELKVILNRKRITQLGTNSGLVTATISTYFSGSLAGVYQEGADEYKILVRVPPAVRKDVERLKSVPVFMSTGAIMPLASVASFEENIGPTMIERKGQRRVVKVLASQTGTRALNEVAADVHKKLQKMDWPEGTVWTIGGAAEDMKDSMKYMAFAFLAALLLVYMVMASQFESLLEPFVILLSVPLSVIGVALALWVTNTTLSMTAGIGVVMLAGIVVNNAIVLIDYLKQQWDGRWDTLIDVAVEAGVTRLRPILMTTLTTVLAMVPLALGIGEGAETWAPMARAVIGGLMTSMLLTLIVVPAWYVLIAGWRARRRERRAARLAERKAALADTPDEPEPDPA